MKEILQHLKNHGEQFDAEIAEGTGLSLTAVRLQLLELAAKKEIVSCHSIRFEMGREVEGTRCRLAGYTPLAARGRKSKAQLMLS